MDKLVTLNAECNRLYCNKCNKLYDDNEHKAFIDIYCDDISANAYHVRHNVFVTPSYGINIPLCPECGAKALRINSIEMSILITNMIRLGFIIHEAHDRLHIDSSGLIRIEYVYNSYMIFTAPYQMTKFIRCAENEGIIRKVINEDRYRVDFSKSYQPIMFLQHLKEYASYDNIERSWMNVAGPAILRGLITKGYNVIESKYNDGRFEVIVDNQIGESDIDNGILVSPNAILFIDFSKKAECVKWVQMLPEYN